MQFGLIKTSPFEFYQYWRNVDDADVLKCIKMLTFLPIEEISKMESWEGSQLNKAKEILAFELTKLVHGEEEANKAQEGARALFSGSGNTENMPTTTLSSDEFNDGSISLIDMMLKAAIIKSRGEGRRLIEQGGVTVDDKKAESFAETVGIEAFEKGQVIVKKGKKVFVKFILE